MNRKTTEDYLKAIYQAQSELAGAADGVSTTAVAERLGVAAASVTGMLKKLAVAELVTYTPYQGVILTEAGRNIAIRVVRRHRVAERYLQDVLGLSWDQVHVEAEEWEHVLSDQVIEAMDRLLGAPTVDPHGEPIPTATGQLAPLTDTPLSRLTTNETATVSRVGNEDSEFLRYVGSLGLYPNVALVVLDVAPFDGPVTVEVGGKRAAIGRKAADQVFVVNVYRRAEEA